VSLGRQPAADGGGQALVFGSDHEAAASSTPVGGRQSPGRARPQRSGSHGRSTGRYRGDVTPRSYLRAAPVRWIPYRLAWGRRALPCSGGSGPAHAEQSRASMEGIPSGKATS
jgi:hypothetical protein